MKYMWLFNWYTIIGKNALVGKPYSNVFTFHTKVLLFLHETWAILGLQCLTEDLCMLFSLFQRDNKSLIVLSFYQYISLSFV